MTEPLTPEAPVREIAPRTGAAPAAARPRRSLEPVVLGTLGVAATVLVWALLAQRYGGGTAIKRLAGPVEVARGLGTYATDGLARDVWASLKVFFGGWLVGGGAAAVLGLILGRVRLAGDLFLPVVEAIRPVSSIAWVPLSIVWFGFGYTGKAFVVGLAVFLVVIVYAVDGSTRIAADVERTATMLGMSATRRFVSVVLPGTLGEVMIGLRVALTAGWGTVIVAELVAANSGLGAHLIAKEQYYDIAGVMVTMVCFAVTGFLMNAIFSRAQARLMPWQQEAGR